MSGCTFSNAEYTPIVIQNEDMLPTSNYASFNGCHGIAVADEWIGPSGQFGPHSPPDGWRNATLGLTYSADTIELTCQELLWQDLKINNITFALEAHSAYYPPATCRDVLPDAVTMRYINTIFHNNSLLASQMKSEGIKTIEANITTTQSPLDGYTLTINPSGYQPSIIEVIRPGPISGSSATQYFAYFWHSPDGGANVVVLKKSPVLTLGDLTMVDFQPPLIMSDMSITRPALTQITLEVVFKGTILNFEDSICEHER